ncbi:MAG: CBS domain-containing protein [Deltaproteobacteria bacterium]|nr:CBS domain-containing protein [Deltaproteobacteria bacterium]
MIAADVMTNDPRTVRVNDSIGEAWQVFRELDIRHVPVVNDDGDLVGILSDRDLSGRTRESLPVSTLRVADVMSGSVVAVNPQTDLREVIEALLEHRIGAIPVVDGESKVVGIISYVDVLRSFDRAIVEATAP